MRIKRIKRTERIIRIKRKKCINAQNAHKTHVQLEDWVSLAKLLTIRPRSVLWHTEQTHRPSFTTRTQKKTVWNTNARFVTLTKEGLPPKGRVSWQKGYCSTVNRWSQYVSEGRPPNFQIMSPPTGFCFDRSINLPRVYIPHMRDYNNFALSALYRL